MIYFISALSLDWFVVRYLDSDLILVPKCVMRVHSPLPLRDILRKPQANDPGGAKGRRIRTYLTKVRALCARAYGAPAIRGSITDSYLSFLLTRVH